MSTQCFRFLTAKYFIFIFYPINRKHAIYINISRSENKLAENIPFCSNMAPMIQEEKRTKKLNNKALSFSTSLSAPKVRDPSLLTTCSLTTTQANACLDVLVLRKWGFIFQELIVLETRDFQITLKKKYSLYFKLQVILIFQDI